MRAIALIFFLTTLLIPATLLADDEEDEIRTVNPYESPANATGEITTPPRYYSAEREESIRESLHNLRTSSRWVADASQFGRISTYMMPLLATAFFTATGPPDVKAIVLGSALLTAAAGSFSTTLEMTRQGSSLGVLLFTNPAKIRDPELRAQVSDYRKWRPAVLAPVTFPASICWRGFQPLLPQSTKEIFVGSAAVASAFAILRNTYPKEMDAEFEKFRKRLKNSDSEK